MTGSLAWSDVARWLVIYLTVLALLTGGVLVGFQRRRVNRRRARRTGLRDNAPQPGLLPQTQAALPSQGPVRAVVGAPYRRGAVGATAISSGHAAVSADVMSAPGLRALASSVVGRDHLARALSREDAYASYRLSEDVGSGLCVAIADGVSGAPRSQVYALALATAAVQTLAAVWPEPPPTLLDRVAHRAEEVSKVLMALGADAIPARSQERPGSPAATLALAAAVPTADGLTVTWWQVGDARVGVLDTRTGECRWLSGPGGGDGHLTPAMPGQARNGASGQWHLQVGTWLVLASDGAEPMLEAFAREVLTAVGGRGDSLESLSRLTAVLGATIEGEHDDRTVVLLASDGTA